MATLVSSYQTGKRYIQLKANGAIQISKKPKTAKQKKLSENDNWLLSRSGDELNYSGLTDVAELLNLPEGASLEVFDSEEAFYNRASKFAKEFEPNVNVKKNELILHDGNLYRVLKAHKTALAKIPDQAKEVFLKLISKKNG